MPCSLQYSTDNLSLIERISWIDDSKEVESFKKETLTAYEDVTIGEGMASETIEEWKYGIEDNNTYLMCKYSVDKKKEIIIFYKDNYDNINIAEYYIDDTKQDKDVIKAFGQENAEYAATAARNAEIASAHVLLAQSRSRLLTKTEQATLQSVAQKIIAHADGEVIAPAVIEFSETPAEATSAVETREKKGSAATDNASLVSFADIK